MALSPFALQFAPVLRILRDDQQATPPRRASIRSLAEQSGVPKTTLLRNLDALAEAGWISDGDNRRVTAAGEAILAEIDDAEANPPQLPGAPAAAPAADGERRQLQHDQIAPSKLNPRKTFDDDAIDELAASIAEKGLLQNLVVRPSSVWPETFELVAGERRWRAIGRLIKDGRWPADRGVDVLVRQMTDDEHSAAALIENMVRRDLNPIEEAEAIRAYRDATGKSNAEVAELLNVSPRFVQQRLQLLRLPPVQQVALREGKMTVEAAREALRQIPEPLSDRAKLAMLEFLTKAAARPYKPYEARSYAGTLVVAQTVRTDVENSHTRVSHKVDDPAFRELVKRRLIDDPRPVYVENIETGRHYVQRAYDWKDDNLKAAIPGAENPKAWPGMLAELRVNLLGLQADYELTSTGRFATEWLNLDEDAPLAPDVLAAIDAARAEREQREAESKARRDKEKAAVRAAEAERKARLSEAATAQAAAAEAHPGHVRESVQLLARIGNLNLPLYVTDGGEVIDAAGDELLEIYPFGPNGEQAVDSLRLLVGIVNAAAGFVTPQGEPEKIDPDANRDSFLALVAAELQRPIEEGDDPFATDAEVALKAATAGLNAFLAQEGISFGNAEYDWDAEGARVVAWGIVVDGLGQQVYLEEAIAAKADDDAPEISPALAALATGHAAKIAAPEAAE